MGNITCCLNCCGSWEQGNTTLETTMSWYDICEEEEEIVVQVGISVETFDSERSYNIEQIVQHPDFKFMPSHEQHEQFVCSNHDGDRPAEDQAIDKCDNDDLPSNAKRSKIGSQARHFRNTERNAAKMQQPALNGIRHHDRLKIKPSYATKTKFFRRDKKRFTLRKNHE